MRANGSARSIALALVAEHRRAGGGDRATWRSSCSVKSIRYVVVPVRRVELQHRELGVVARTRDAFVAEVAVDLEHALEAADDQALQVQLRRDAQEHVAGRARCGGSRTAWPRRRPGSDCSIGVSTSRKPCATMKSRIAAMRLAARHEAARASSFDDQVDVALPVALLAVGEAVELVGQRPQRSWSAGAARSPGPTARRSGS